MNEFFTKNINIYIHIFLLSTRNCIYSFINYNNELMIVLFYSDYLILQIQ